MTRAKLIDEYYVPIPRSVTYMIDNVRNQVEESKLGFLQNWPIDFLQVQDPSHHQKYFS